MMRWVSFVACICLALPMIAPAQAGDDPQPVTGAETAAQARLADLKEHATRSENLGQFEARKQALMEIIRLVAATPDLPLEERASAQHRLAKHLFERESDFSTARLLLLDALRIFRATRGEQARETLEVRADLIFYRRLEAEFALILIRPGEGSVFGTGDPIADKKLSAQDLLVFRDLSRATDASDVEDSIKLAHWANYVQLLNETGNYNAAMNELRDRMQAYDRRMKDGEFVYAKTRLILTKTMFDTFFAEGRFELAWRTSEQIISFLPHYFREELLLGGVSALASNFSQVPLFTSDFLRLSWRLAQDQDAAGQAQLRAAAFRAVQLGGINPASVSVSRQAVNAIVRDASVRADFDSWLRLSPNDDTAALQRSRLAERINAVQPGLLDNLFPEPVSIASLQGQNDRAILNRDEALVFIVYRTLDAADAPHANGYVFAVTREGSAWVELPLSWDELLWQILSLHHHLDPRGGDITALAASRAPQSTGGAGTNKATVTRSAAFDFDAAHSLYQAIFGAPEIARLIADKPVWTIIPDGIMMSIPFAALIVEDSGGGAMRSAHELRAITWLGQSRALNVVPSVPALRDLRQVPPVETPGARLSYIGIGDPQFQGADTAVLQTADAVFTRGADRGAALRALPRLPGTRREVEQLAALFQVGPDNIRLGTKASEAEIRALSENGTLARADIVHIATHGLLAGAFEGLSEPALALTPPEAAETGNDGVLTASEATQLRLSAEWVILSACDTAGANDIRGGGLGGLVRGFFSAGARNLLVSHWRVDDQAAARLITDTVALNREGTGKADALRRAMVSLASDETRDGNLLPNAHPSVWAPFVLVGGG